MKEIITNTAEKYSLSEKESYEIEEVFGNIINLISIANDYCKHNIENPKFSFLLTLIEQTQSESIKIADKF